MDTIKKDLFSIVVKIELMNEKAIFKEKLIQLKNDIYELCKTIPNARYFYLQDVLIWQKFNSLVEIGAFENLLNALHNEFTFHCIINYKLLDPTIAKTTIFSQAAQVISKIENCLIKINYYDFALNYTQSS